jgi:hypothetical protein
MIFSEAGFSNSGFCVPVKDFLTPENVVFTSEKTPDLTFFTIEFKIIHVY